MKNKIGFKIVSTTLLCTMLTYTAPIFAYTKDETVYSNLDSTGNDYETIVSTHIKNDDSLDLINDVSDLLNIENTNGDESFTQDGNSIIWKADKNDIFYQGESQKDLPVECNVKYELDGKEINPDELAGKSGNVKISLQYTNKDEHIVNIDGKDVKMYTPFVVVAGTIIQNDSNKNITVTNGKVINDGTKSIVMGIALPGMQESLGLSKDKIDIPNTIEISSLDATNFESSNIITFITPKVLEESDLESFDDLDEIYEKVSTLQTSSKQIKAGADTLATGAVELNKGVSSAYRGSKQMQSEVQKATKTLKSDKTDALNKGQLNQIGNQAAKVATNTIEKQKETIGKQAATQATNTIEKQKETIGKQAATEATNTIGKQKETIGKQAETQATNTIEKQKETIGSQASKVAISTIEKQKETIGKQAAKEAVSTITKQKETIQKQASSQVKDFKLSDAQISKIKKAVESGLEKNDNYKKLTKEQKALVLPFAQSAAESAAQIAASQVANGVASEVAGSVAEQVASQVANQTAQTVAEQIAGQVANETAQSVASSTAGQVASQTAQSVASSTASQVASQTAQSVASSTASQVANQTAQTVAEQTASETAKTTATSVAETVANEVKSTAQKSISSQMEKLGEGLEELTTGLSTINKGTGELSEGANTLSKGITTFNEEGINKICNYINGDVKDITNRVEKLNELSKQYNNFAMINGENEGNVKFIMIIDSIKKHEENDQSKESAILNDEQKTDENEEK